MSGHSKWSNIKRQKESTDKAKSKIFGKLARLITLAVIGGGGGTNPDHNVKLRLALEKAKQDNMPKDNIARALQKGSGPQKINLTEIRYEGYSHDGVALYMIATTDNSNRTAAEVKNVLERHGAKMASPGAVSYLFEHCGIACFAKSENKEADVLAMAEKIQASDIEVTDEQYIVYFPFSMLGKVTGEDFKLTFKSSPESTYKPVSTIAISEGRMREKLDQLITALVDLDDVHEVYVNAQS